MDSIPAILGPTASGKTDIAIALALKINGEVIGLDSRQIFKNMEIGTAQPTKDERKKIKHHLIGELSPDENISAGGYAKLVQRKIKKIRLKGKIPIICGGSGLYYRAISKGIFDNSSTNLNIREQLEEAYKDKGPDLLYKKLKIIDPDYSNIVHPNNKKRLIRALEIYQSTGIPPSEHFEKQEKDFNSNFYSIYIDWTRDDLTNRIKKRVKKMIESGWIEEVEKLLKKYSLPKTQAMNSIGYSEIETFLKNKGSMSDLIDKIVLKSRQFAVKQIKWFKKEPIDLRIKMNSNLLLDDIIKTIPESIFF